MTAAEYRNMKRPKHKFKAKPVEHDGIRFDSKLEARYYELLKTMQKQGVVVFFLRQVPFHLPGGTKMVIDFLIFWADGSVTFEDAKGYETKEFKIKKREVEAAYPIVIQVIKDGDF